MKVEVSNGEIIDKITILKIKLEKIKEENKLANLKKEYDELIEVSSSIIDMNNPLFNELYQVNLDLWNIEDHIRNLEREKNFGEEFIATAREVYFKNDKRSEIKRKINLTTESKLIEEKSYEDY